MGDEHPDDVGPFLCECCPRMSDAGDADTASAAGWAFTLDGWICPSCCDELEQETPR